LKLSNDNGKTPEDTGIDNYFLNKAPIVHEIRPRINQWNCIKLKSFCTSKETIARIKRQSTE
jgi:hypothetical protein